MQELIAQLASGLATGSIYACTALSLVMIYQSTHHINFAQGEMAMLTTYVAATLIGAGVPYWAAFGLTIVFAFGFGYLIQRLLLRPLRNATPLSMVIVFIGLLVIMNAAAGWLFTYNIRTFPSPFPASHPFGLTILSFHELGMMGVTLAMVAALFAFLKYTPVGLAMRAAAQNPVSSRLSGIPVGTMLALGWGLAAAIGAVGGMLIAPMVFLDPNMMSGVLIYGVAAALLGGIDNPWGAVAGGLIVGVTENLAGAYVVGTDLKLTVALVVIVGVLMLRPAGLFGRRVVARV